MRLARIASALFLLALAGYGCGGGSSYANDQRPPSPVTLTASIGKDGVRISPAKVGAGPISIIIVNLTDRTMRVTVESDTLGASKGGLKQQTAPINPQGTAKLQLDVEEGRYMVHSGDDDNATTLRVGKTRKSSQGDLLLP